MNKFNSTGKSVIREAGNIKAEVAKRTTSYIAAGLGFIAGLAWNDAIRTFIDYIFPAAKSTIIAKFLYALVLTFAVSAVLFYLEKMKKD